MDDPGIAQTYEEQLKALARKQDRSIEVLIAEAIRDYLEAAAITDLEPADVAATQMAMAGELTEVDAAIKTALELS